MKWIQKHRDSLMVIGFITVVNMARPVLEMATSSGDMAANILAGIGMLASTIAFGLFCAEWLINKERAQALDIAVTELLKIFLNHLQSQVGEARNRMKNEELKIEIKRRLIKRNHD